MKENSKLAVELHRQHMLYCLPLFYLGLYLHDEQKRKHNYTRFQNGPDVRHPNLEKKTFASARKQTLSGFKIHFRFGFTVSTLLLRMRRSTIITTSALKIDLKFMRKKTKLVLLPVSKCISNSDSSCRKHIHTGN